MSKNRPKDHFVPVTYLKNFALKGDGGQDLIYYVDPKQVESGETKFRNIHDICAEKDLYDMPGKTFKERDAVDTFYNEAYEDHWTPVYRKLVDEQVQTLTDEERRIAVGMACSLFYKNKFWYDFINGVRGDALKNAYEWSKHLGNDYFWFMDEKIFIKGRSLEEIKREHEEKSKPYITLSGAQATLRLQKKRLDSDGITVTTIKDAESTFLTSEDPVRVIDPDGGLVVPSNPNNFLSLPLDHKHNLDLIPDRPKEYLNYIERDNSDSFHAFAWNTQQLKRARYHLIGSPAGLKIYQNTVGRINKGIFPW